LNELESPAKAAGRLTLRKSTQTESLLFGQKIVEIWFLQLSRKAVIGFVVAF
jgi:hypothetical protein